MNRRSVFPCALLRGVLPRADRRAARRADILAAAAQVFGEKGYHDASIAEIAAAAGFGTGTIYLYFENKEELYVALLEEKMRALAKIVNRRAGNCPKPWEAIRNAVAAQLEFYEGNRTFFQSFVRERLEMRATLRRQKWDRVVTAYESFLGRLSSLISDGQRQGVVRPGNSRRLALALAGIVNQVTRDALRRRSSQSLAGQAAFVVDLFENGARRREMGGPDA